MPVRNYNLQGLSFIFLDWRNITSYLICDHLPVGGKACKYNIPHAFNHISEPIMYLIFVVKLMLELQSCHQIYIAPLAMYTPCFQTTSLLAPGCGLQVVRNLIRIINEVHLF